MRVVINRRGGERIVIGGWGELFVKVGDEFVSLDPLHIHVVRADDDKVRLGFDIPEPVSVHRHEVYQAIKREREGGDRT